MGEPLPVTSRSCDAFPAVGAHQLRAELRRFDCDLLVPGAGGIVAHPALIGKLRGALGVELLNAASAEARNGLPCSWAPPCPYDVLWRKQDELRPGFPVPAPYILRTDNVGGDLIVRLSLFGRAGDYLGEAGDALIRALRRGLSGPKTLKLEPSQRQFEEVVGLPDPRISAQARLRFTTPLVLRNSDQGSHIDPSALLRSLIDRAAGLAWWHGVQLAEDLPALKEATKQIAGAWERVDVEKWTRGAVQQRRKVPMEGALGVANLRGDLAPFSDFIALGQVFHAGSRTAWGQGRYDIEHAL